MEGLSDDLLGTCTIANTHAGNRRPIIARPGVILGGQFMRQVDHDAQVAPRRALGRAASQSMPVRSSAITGSDRG